jgi:hypothetical protein
LKFKKQLESEKRQWFEEKEAEISRVKASSLVENSIRSSVSQHSTDSVKV